VQAAYARREKLTEDEQRIASAANWLTSDSALWRRRHKRALRADTAGKTPLQTLLDSIPMTKEGK